MSNQVCMHGSYVVGRSKTGVETHTLLRLDFNARVFEVRMKMPCSQQLEKMEKNHKKKNKHLVLSTHIYYTKIITANFIH